MREGEPKFDGPKAPSTMRGLTAEAEAEVAQSISRIRQFVADGGTFALPGFTVKALKTRNKKALGALRMLEQLYDPVIIQWLVQEENQDERESALIELCSIIEDGEEKAFATLDRIFLRVISVRGFEALKELLIKRLFSKLGLEAAEVDLIFEAQRGVLAGDLNQIKNLEVLFEKLGLDAEAAKAISTSWERNAKGFISRNDAEHAKKLLHLWSVYCQNLFKMFLVEKLFAGGVKRLFEECNLRTFSKFPFEFILDQVNPKQSGEPFFGVSAAAENDDFTFHNNNSLLLVRLQGGRLAIVECSSREDVVGKLARVGSVDFALISTHANSNLMLFGFEGDGACLYTKDASNYFGTLKPYLRPGANLIFEGCEIGKGKMPQIASKVLKDVVVVAPCDETFNLGMHCVEGHLKIKYGGSEGMVICHNGKSRSVKSVG